MQQDTIEMLRSVCDNLVTVTGFVRKDTDEVVRTNNHVDIIKHYNHVRVAAASIKEAREALNKMEENLSREVIPTIVADLKQRTGEKPPFVIEGVGRVSVAHRFSCSMPDKGAGIQWLKGNGHGDIVQETVNSQTLSSFARNLLENEGIELPDDLFKVSTSPYTSITKGK